MAGKRAVLFSFWGVVVRSKLDSALLRAEEQHGLPRGFLVQTAGSREGALSRALRGDTTLSQMIPELEAELVVAAQDQGVTLPSDWSLQGMVDDVRATQLDAAALQSASTLRRNGVLTAVLANHWVDDGAMGCGWARQLATLGGHFDLVLQSCRCGHMVPEPAMFTAALQGLGVAPQQAVWLGEDEEGLRAAEGLGMKSIMVKELQDALRLLEELTGVQADAPPPLCFSPNDFSHGFVTIKPGVQIHYVEAGSGFPVLLCHGFPESWFSWRHQIPALAAAGFRVLALDMKGYGESTAPPDIEEYSQEQLCKDLITFMDKMSIPRVTLVGHDWGGALVWSMAQYHPERVRAVASLNTPLFPVDPSVPPMERIRALPIFDYQLYFQQPGVAEAELEKDLERTFKIIFFGSNDTEGRPAISTAGVCARGGLFVGLPDQVPKSSMLTEAELQFYVSRYKETGFRRPLNWYRNVVQNWTWMCSRPRGKLMMPALMVTAGKDNVLLPVMSKGMEDMIPNLTRGHIEECGHWTQMERPSELNSILISWLQETHKEDGVAMTPKL